jgi:hypothetical protein
MSRFAPKRGRTIPYRGRKCGRRYADCRAPPFVSNMIRSACTSTTRALSPDHNGPAFSHVTSGRAESAPKISAACQPGAAASAAERSIVAAPTPALGRAPRPALSFLDAPIGRSWRLVRRTLLPQAIKRADTRAGSPKNSGPDNPNITNDMRSGPDQRPRGRFNGIWRGVALYAGRGCMADKLRYLGAETSDPCDDALIPLSVQF